MAVKIQLRRGTSSEWTSANPILLIGEIGLETNTKKFKIGDGSTSWNSLTYATQGEVGMRWLGAYSGVTSYIVGDLVSYNNSSYICKSASTGNLPTNTTYWDLVALSGTAITVNNISQSGGNISLTQDNIPSGITNKVYTVTEQTKLAGVEVGAEVNNISDINATDLTDGGITTLHKHNASDISVSDPSNYFTATNVEDALAETANIVSTKANETSLIPLANAIDNLAESTKSVIPDVSVSTYSKVSSLSPNAREGQMNVKVSGNTLKNEVREGNFPDTSEWSSATNATVSATNNTLYITGNGVGANASAYQLTGLDSTIVNRKLYFKARIRVTNANCTQCQLELQPSSTGTNYSLLVQVTPVQKQWYEVNTIVTTPTGKTGNYRIRALHAYADAATANGKVMEVQDVICIDMGTDTSNPLYNKTAAEMDLIAGQNYFDGLSSVVAGSVKSVGKNLFDGKLESGKIEETTGASVNDSTMIRTASFLPVKKVDLILSNEIIANCRWHFYDINKNYISTYFNNTLKIAGTSIPVNAYYFKFWGASTNFTKGINSQVQLEEGTSATAYEPYTETIRTLPSSTLRSLPNGVKDYVDGNRLVQNTKEYVLQDADITLSMDTSNINVDRARIFKPSDAIFYNNTSANIGAVVLDKYIQKATVTDSTGDVGSYTLSASNTIIYIGFAKGTTLEQARTSLTGTKIIYQLATPIVTELLPEPLKSSPKGSVIYTNQRKEIGTYTTNATVSNTSAPIKTMNRLWKILADSTRVPLSVVTGLTIAGDKLSFTHTGLVSGDNIEWEYEFDTALSTTPLLDYGYKNSPNKFGAITVPTFTNSWVVDGVGGYYVNGDETILVGSVKSGTVNTAIFTLPTDTRPLHTVKTIVNANGAIGYLTVNTDGTVVLTSGSNVTVSLEGVRFRNDV